LPSGKLAELIVAFQYPMFAVPLPRLISIMLVALLLVLSMVRFTRFVLNCELFIDTLIRKFPDMFAFACGRFMVLLGGTLLIMISEMFTMFWLPAKSVAFCCTVRLVSLWCQMLCSSSLGRCFLS